MALQLGDSTDAQSSDSTKQQSRLRDVHLHLPPPSECVLRDVHLHLLPPSECVLRDMHLHLPPPSEFVLRDMHLHLPLSLLAWADLMTRNRCDLVKERDVCK